MKIGEKIRELRKRKGISPERLGMLSDISGAYIRKLEAGQNISITLATAQKLARGLEIPVAALLDEKELPPIPVPPPQEALRSLEVSIKAYIPVYAEVSAGEGIDPIDYVATTRAKPAPKSLRAYRVKGLCMEPDILEGDTLIVDTDLQPDPGNLVIVIIDGQASVKRFRGEYLENNQGRCRPEEVYVHGVVIEVSRKVR